MIAPKLCAITATALAALSALTTAAAQPLAGDRPQMVTDQYVAEPPGVVVSTWTEGLRRPWSLIFLPDGRALVSEIADHIRLIEADGRLQAAPYAERPAVYWLMGLALHPRFPIEPYVYAMETRRRSGGGMESAIV